MSNEKVNQVLHILNEMQEELHHALTEALCDRVPVVGISDQDLDPVVHHHQNMSRTAERFHEIVQAGAGIDWNLVSSEFGWAERKLSTMGVTHDHHIILIDEYFNAARKLREWSDEELAILDIIAQHIHTIELEQSH